MNWFGGFKDKGFVFKQGSKYVINSFTDRNKSIYKWLWVSLIFSVLRVYYFFHLQRRCWSDTKALLFDDLKTYSDCKQATVCFSTPQLVKALLHLTGACLSSPGKTALVFQEKVLLLEKVVTASAAGVR